MTVDAANLLNAWERGHAQAPAARALLLLGLAGQAEEGAALQRLSIGERDARLMGLRERWFGARIDGLGRCPHCAQDVEIGFSLPEIRLEHGHPDTRFDGVWGGGSLQLRLPNSTDLLALRHEPDPAHARRHLLARCVVTSDDADEDTGAACVAALDDAQIEQIERRMAELDPQAEVLLALQCPNCGQPSQVPFEIENFLWFEVDRWAHELLADVYRLAAGYGWGEREILGLSPVRRRAYLDLLG